MSRERNFKPYIKSNNTTTSRGVSNGRNFKKYKTKQTYLHRRRSVCKTKTYQFAKPNISPPLEISPQNQTYLQHISTAGDQSAKLNISPLQEISSQNQTYLHRRRSEQNQIYLHRRRSAQNIKTYLHQGRSVQNIQCISATGDHFKKQNVSPPWSFQPSRSQFDLKGIISICYHHKNISLLCSKVNPVFTSPAALGKAKTEGLLEGQKLQLRQI